MMDGVGRDGMRAADADRQRVADHLRTALGEGRLDLHEYDDRLQRAYAAKTYGELDVLLADLPTASAPRPPVAAPASGNAAGEWLGQVWSSWFFVVAVTSAVWGVSCLASGQVQYYWPVWVAGPWAVLLILASIGGLASGAPRKMVEERERKALAKERKRERRALRAEASGTKPEKGDMSASRAADTPDPG